MSIKHDLYCEKNHCRYGGCGGTMAMLGANFFCKGKAMRSLFILCGMVVAGVLTMGEMRSYMPFSPKIGDDGRIIKTEAGDIRGFVVSPAGKAKDSDNFTCTYYCAGEAIKKVKTILEGRGAKKFINTDFKCTIDNRKPARRVSPDIGQLIQFHDEDKKAKRLWRQDIFKHVMDVDEILFWDYVSKDNNSLNRFPLLQAIITEYKAGGKVPKKIGTGINIDDLSIAGELEDFPMRQNLLGSEFEVLSIGELKKKTIAKAKNPGKVVLLDGYATWQDEGLQKALKSTDVRYQMEQERGTPAAFQIASNFDTLEGGMNPPGKLLTGMQYMAVQGENAALSGMGQTLIRKLIINMLYSNFNLLQNLSKKITVKGGRVTGITTDLDDNDIDKILVAIHKNVAVTSGYHEPYAARKQPISGLKSDAREKYMYENGIVRDGRNPLYIYNSFIDPKNAPRVHQIFTAALDMNQGHKNGSFPNNRETAQVILKAGYLGTVLSAAVNGCKELYLTLVGAGSFKNDLKDIVAAINQPAIVDAVAKAGMTVYVVVYPDPQHKQDACSQEIYDMVADVNKQIAVTGKNQPEKSVEEAGGMVQRLSQCLTQISDGIKE